MQRINNQKHRLIPNSPLLQKLRRDAKRGSEVILYRDRDSGNHILAETNGNITRELAVIPGYPRPTSKKYWGLVRQLRPHPKTMRTRSKLLRRILDDKRENQRNKGRFVREFMHEVQSKMKGVKKDHPAMNWPKIPGEGV